MKKEKLEEIRDLLIVVDMVNGFVREGALHSRRVEGIIPRIENLVNQYLDEDAAVAFVKDTHDPGAREFKRFPVHCLRGTSEAELVDELKKYEHMALVYEKNSTSYSCVCHDCNPFGFCRGTDLYVSSKGKTRLLLVGENQRWAARQLQFGPVYLKPNRLPW